MELQKFVVDEEVAFAENLMQVYKRSEDVVRTGQVLDANDEMLKDTLTAIDALRDGTTATALVNSALAKHRGNVSAKALETVREFAAAMAQRDAAAMAQSDAAAAATTRSTKEQSDAAATTQSMKEQSAAAAAAAIHSMQDQIEEQKKIYEERIQ